MLAGEIGRWAGPLALPSQARRHLLNQVSAWCDELAAREDVIETVVFRGALRPPGEGAELLHHAGVRPARYDVVVLIRTRGTGSIEEVRADNAFRAMADGLERTARHGYQVAAGNAARIADVDHGPDHWFLFNYFHCDDAETVYAVWEYTAGWFQNRTALPNSTLLRPMDGERMDYSVVNHASWPRLRTFLPGLLFRPSFRSFVLANFKANGVAAQPVIYRRVLNSDKASGTPAAD
ncbi:hypothetical protein M1247_34710 [Mycobacterium sp. 21AC1]|uniref:hypothetical protein n=1 Tax=[Mycobacterium] appelbergii TaxID=2939269 RepID=UPI0029393AE5|nr:hypothetical protein [Mycobacterium sp. 21AC1]MDV3130099.1 hypothetical protein [Mycobacterium sp. 21AC1]